MVHCMSTTEPSLQFLCNLADLDHSGAYGLTKTINGKPFEVLLVKNSSATNQGKSVLAYHNSCPHQQMPLETFEHEFLDKQNPSLLVCSTHGARFRLSDGHCISGPSKGQALTPLDTTIQKNKIFLIVPVLDPFVE